MQFIVVALQITLPEVDGSVECGIIDDVELKLVLVASLGRSDLNPEGVREHVSGSDGVIVEDLDFVDVRFFVQFLIVKINCK